MSSSSIPDETFPSQLTVPVLTNTDPLPKAIIPVEVGPPDAVVHANEPGRRPEIYKETLGADQFGIIEKPLTVFERMFNQGWLRKLLLIIALATIWEVYARWLNNDLLVPTFSASIQALWQSVMDGVLPARVWTSIGVLLRGYATGIALASILTILAIGTRIGTDFLELMTAMFNPLPAIALLPLALIWFGLGTGSIVFVIVHSVLWAVALNTHSGFRSVSATHKMVGKNYGLGGLRLVISILIPAAFPSILTGLKIGWAFAWRTLIAAELVFGVSSGKGGLGWYIFEAKNQLNIPEVFGGLLTIIMIGLFVENVIFRWIEGRTIQRWGMQN
jgi:NitT/TauT family transport system permease protein